MNVEEYLKTDKEISISKKTLIHLMLVNNKIGETISETLKPFGISTQQFNVLRILRGQNRKPANLQTISERMVNKMSNTTRLVDKLIDKGLVSRTVCPSNRRKVEILITEKGIRELKKIDGYIENAEDLIVKEFTEQDLHSLNELLNKF